MKGKLLAVFVLTASVIILSTQSLLTKVAGTPIENGVGYAGGIREQGRTCGVQACHNVTSDHQEMISSNIPIEGYRRWNKYDVSVTIADPFRFKFGFMASPQAANGDAMGFLFILDDSVQTRLGINYIAVTHTETGTAGPNEFKTWNFQWSPPNEVGNGDIYFFVAANAANSDDTSTGERNYIDTLIIPEALNNGIASQLEGFDISVGPNPTSDVVNLAFQGVGYQKIQYQLYDLQGRIVAADVLNVSAGATSQIDLSLLPTGSYLLRLRSEDESSVVRFNIVLVLANIKMNPPQVYLCTPS